MAAVLVAAAVVAVAAEEDKEDKDMSSYMQKKETWLSLTVCSVALAMMLIVLAFPSQGCAAREKQKMFASPEEAVNTLVGAMKAGNMDELLAIFGPAGKEVLSSGDPVGDKTGRERFLGAYEKKNAIVRESDGKAVLEIGAEEWPFPIPIVKRGETWFFDTKQGKEELINRRIGKNELNTIQACLAYVDGQREYAAKDRDGDGLLQYAQKFVSTPGMKDGLYWEAKDGEDESPFGDLFVRAVSEGYKKTGDKPVAYHGYYFKILKAQGKNAPGGVYDYMVKGKMVGGFALIAWPAIYGVSGVVTFLVNHDGVVYQKDLGRNTTKIAGAMKRFDPDKTWKKAE